MRLSDVITIEGKQAPIIQEPASSSITKIAAQLLREQDAELQGLRAKIACLEKAEHIVSTLVEQDQLTAVEVLKKLAELRNRPIEELEVMEKAAELYSGNTLVMGLGTLSDETEYSSQNNLLNYLLGDV